MGGKFKNKNKVKTPLERLDKSHRRLEERLEELQASTAALQRGGSQGAHWDSVADVLAYLERAGVRHAEDEEETVFPRLALHPRLRPLLTRLRSDHKAQQKFVTALAKIVVAPKTQKSVLALTKITKALRADYLDHIRREDRQLLPAIARHISAPEQALMAAEMAARRE